MWRKQLFLNLNQKSRAVFKILLKVFLVLPPHQKQEQGKSKKLLCLQKKFASLSRNHCLKKNLGSESKVKRSKNSPVSVVLNANEKKEDEKRTTITGVKATTASFQADSSTNSGENRGKSGVKGKVKEFVHVFNREPLSKPKDNVNSRSQDSKSKQRGTFRAENEVDEDKKKFETENSGIRTTSDNTSSGQDDKSTSSTAPVPDSSGSTSRYTASDFQGNFVIDELGQVENELPQTSNNRRRNPGNTEDIDAKIRKWSSGKEGNIRSLLSTLQYVLWPESGWKPVPLVNIIEGNAVKRAYQKALLCLHPDKLQQKGATSHQKYIAEKVFDILKEAWTHFNLVGAV
ncbi:J domain-containing protein required for chloroplast accumulation response 1 [Quillaja saponaria]|uniref:J domain-containing protein required for chloroplast accumulation response 1 n=1 Tax=Quillaja saponaria TaxID=32244 RepID=A0AAD7LYT1_QUISA|nr:J domain-containing protein required for chloroplast accumulation response 1 [Quillaja saponaria]KAJ7966728.1 J domain-containing protein required for chloroplast accumulation response 1 [Quillaja saponaria]